MASKQREATMKTPPIVSEEEWKAAREQLLVKEKAFTRSRDALAAERRYAHVRLISRRSRCRAIG